MTDNNLSSANNSDLNENIDPSEIEKFSAIADNWWDKKGLFKPLHKINPLRLSYIMERADGLFGKHVLDVGCGGGILAEAMAKEGALVTGIDMAEKSLNIARLHAKKNDLDVTYVQSTVEQFADENYQKYDVVTCMEMLEHVPLASSIITSCAKLVKPNGHVFFSTINRNLKSYLFAIIGAEKILKLVPDGTHDHRKFIKPSELMNMTDKTSLIAKNMTGLTYNIISKEYQLASNIDVNYILHCQNNLQSK